MEDSELKITLLSVNELPDSTVINRRMLRKLGNDPVSVDMNVRVLPDVERSVISLVVTCTYIGVIGMIRTRILTSSVIATFEIEKLVNDKRQANVEVVVDAELMKTMLSIAVGALRGIVAVRTADTPLRNTPLPIIDLTVLMYRLNYGRSTKL